MTKRVAEPLKHVNVEVLDPLPVPAGFTIPRKRSMVPESGPSSPKRRVVMSSETKESTKSWDEILSHIPGVSELEADPFDDVPPIKMVSDPPYTHVPQLLKTAPPYTHVPQLQKTVPPHTNSPKLQLMAWTVK